MIFHRNNYDDICRYYKNTIIKLPELSGDRLWQIVSINPDEVRLVDVDGMEIYMDLDHEYNVEYPLPGRAVYQQTSGHAGMLFRKPAKQYYRGISKENTGLSRYSASGDLVGVSWSIQTLQEFVDKPCYQTVESIDLNESPYDSWAINKYMAVCRYGPVMIQNRKIASALWDSKTVHLSYPMFKEEIKAAFPGWKVKV